MDLSRPNYKYSATGERAFAIIDAYKKVVKDLKALRNIGIDFSGIFHEADSLDGFIDFLEEVSRSAVDRMIKEMDGEEREMFDIAQDWSL